MEKLIEKGHEITVLGDLEDGVLEQTLRCLEPEEGSRAVINGDNHLGYSQAIGVGIAYRDHISPSGVGYDIGCGNKAVRTDLDLTDLADPFSQTTEVPRVMDEIFERISFGMGMKNNEQVDHPVIEEIAQASFEPQRAMLDLARGQLGTVGGGNHYVDLFVDETGTIWVGVHFGSRGFGYKTASGFLAMAQGAPFSEAERKSQGIKVSGGEMHSPPVLFGLESEIGQSYLEAMRLAGRYAYAGRDVVVDKVLEILGAKAVEEVHNHHNFAWRERHGGEDFWVVRKGCTPAFPGEAGFVGATMGEESVILEGTEVGEAALFSTVHGAGRVMSRTQAAGKFKRLKRYACMDRDCDRLFELDGINPQNPPPKKGVCPDHPNARVKKVKVREKVRDGEIDWEAETAKMAGIELRGGAADEAPGAYKRLDAVLQAQGPTINVTHRLRPLGVAMASPETVDLYKD